jgi:hypothetical protein
MLKGRTRVAFPLVEQSACNTRAYRESMRLGNAEREDGVDRQMTLGML